MSVLQEPLLAIRTPENQVGLTQVTELTLVEEKLNTILHNSQGIIRETAANLSRGGKRLRPLLTIHSGLCFGTLNLDIIDTAVASELIHLASLIHDDVIDKASTRRGHTTVNISHGNHIAVLCGDYIFAQAFAILANRQILTSIDYLTHAIKEMCQGEVNQADHHFTCIEKETYFKHISKKTGTLLAACCQSGAAVAGASSDQIAKMGEYGHYLGYTYQIIDDLLDFVGDPSVMGKPTGADLINGNITLPVILLMDNPVYSSWLYDLLQTRQITATGLESVKAALLSTGSLDRAYRIAQDYATKAHAALALVPPSGSRQLLQHLVDNALNRLN